MRRTVAVLVTVLVVCGGVYLWQRGTDLHFRAVAENKLYRAAMMTEGKLLDTCQRYGIRTVVDLRKQDPGDAETADEAAFLKANGVRHVRIPTGQVPPPDVVAAFLKIMDDPANHPVLVHCTHGVGRTGVMAAIYRIEYENWSNDKARVEAQRRSGLNSFSLDSRKGKFLMQYVPRDGADSAAP
ncbi:MAG: dual specificity protein phosphatase family protein [Lentisphaerae bacterium]|nr:dual specificity protein phosphatase family protein [Lentisphaerota bacterium]